MRRKETIDRLHTRINDIVSNFNAYLEVFEDSNLFTGPSVYFHNKVLEQMRQHNTPVEALEDDQFFDYLYATLTAWGMHRMGPGNTKLVNMSDLKETFHKQKERIRDIQSITICQVPQTDVSALTLQIWEILDGLQIGIGKTKIVASSKALHHLLPSLVPPIDREYTLNFFFNNKTLKQEGGDEFKEIYPHFQDIAVKCRSKIIPQLYQGMKMNTSETKIIDNAIVGFILQKRKT